MQKYREKIGRQVIEVFHEQKAQGQSRKIVEKYLRSFPWRSCLLKNVNWLRNSLHPIKTTALFKTLEMLL
jgi:hypothetical protein